MSEVYAVTGRVFYGTITKVYDSAFTDGTELVGIQDRECRLTIATSGIELRDPSPEAPPVPGLRLAVTFTLEMDVRGLDAATVALLMDEIDNNSGGGIAGVAGTYRTATRPTTALIVRPLTHTANVTRYLYGPRWVKDAQRSNCRIVYGPRGPHLEGSRLTLKACRAITQTTSNVDHPPAAWDTSARLLTAYENLLAGT